MTIQSWKLGNEEKNYYFTHKIMYIFQLTRLLSFLLRYIIKRIFFQNIPQFIKTAGFLKFQVYWVLWLAMILQYRDREVCPPRFESQVFVVKFRHANIYKPSWADVMHICSQEKKIKTNQTTNQNLRSRNGHWLYIWLKLNAHWKLTNCWNRHRNSIPNWD